MNEMYYTYRYRLNYMKDCKDIVSIEIHKYNRYMVVYNDRTMSIITTNMHIHDIL